MYPRVWIVEKPKFPVKHVGLYIEDRGVFENSPELGRAGWTTWAAFNRNNDATGKEVQGLDLGVVYSRIERIMRAGKPYSAISFNCEHAVNEALAGQPESGQLQGVVALAVLAIAIGVLATKA
jgi:hypothetical protein